jgi:hypothetical protein
MINKTEGIALIAIASIMLVGGTTISLTPVASAQASEQEVEISLSLSNAQSLPSGEKKRIVESNENSENSAAKNTIDRDHDVKQASAADRPALDLERNIETPNKEIKIDVESNDNSRASEQEVEMENSNSCC